MSDRGELQRRLALADETDAELVEATAAVKAAAKAADVDPSSATAEALRTARARYDAAADARLEHSRDLIRGRLMATAPALLRLRAAGLRAVLSVFSPMRRELQNVVASARERMATATGGEQTWGRGERRERPGLDPREREEFERQRDQAQATLDAFDDVTGYVQRELAELERQMLEG